ncbi:hypothetical protein NDI85_11855 [Halomicroarcula sp. S1AR25-4]|uniref:TrmB family transcriptional regulator n=1 Tax=Haloarcula sp. S1AR25-4 TaxID=2950538 RepID=UPI002874A04D|nr:TrmB family transcriptional regulator sugar-binding domain-containing protein [Halomicroarcula sp. S1AR25-4]MDS0278492.1 hypothetical protein [Halomicroarcula sp. S1AR25-4]
MTKQRLRDNLRLLGLSSKEIDVYLTILEHGEAKVSHIVDDSDVSQRYVYELCEKLDERGLVVLNDHVRPSIVRAREAENAITGITTQLEELEQDIATQLATQNLSALEVELIQSRQTIRKRWRKFISEAKEEVFICLPATAFERFQAELAAAVDRDVLVLVLLTEPGLDSTDSEALSSHASLARSWPYEPRPLLTVDNTTVVHDEPKLLVDETADGAAVSLTRSAVAGNLFSTYISNYWRIAEETFRCEPDELPQSYPQLRNAIVHATLHEQAGHDLTATIRAQRTTSDEVVEMEDVPVVEIRQGLIEPFTNRFPIENGISVAYEGEVVSVGGISAIIEEYEALEITLDTGG